MSFLDEGTFVGRGAVQDALKDPEFKALRGDEKAKALQTLKMGGSITTEIEEANAFLAAADAARDKGDKEFEFPEGSGKMHKVTLKKDLDLEEGKLANALGGVAILAGLLLTNKINSNDPVIQRLKAEYEQAEPAKKDSIQKLITKRLIMLDAGEFDDSTPMREGEKEKFNYKAPKDKDKDDIKIDPDTKFTVDLKHLIQKHMKEGKSKENTIKFTKALMAKLHNKGEVTVDGTKITFKEGKKKSGYMGYTEMAEEADLNIRDTQLTLPEPDAPDYLGDDGMDYEGGMAKSQMLKMKNYAKALCDMIEDESQLESWVQAKLTKASDYMSSVYHYLDYQRSKMNESTLNEIEKQEFKFPNSPKVTMKTGMYAKDLTAGSKSEPAIDFVMPSSSKYRDSDNIIIYLSDTKFNNIDTLFNTLKQALGQSNNVDKLSDVRLRQIIDDPRFIKMAGDQKTTIRDIEDEIKNSFRSQGDLDTFMDDLTDEDKKEFLDLMNSGLKGNEYEKALGKLIDRYKG